MTLAAVVVAATFTRTMERVASMDPAMATAVYDSHAVQLVYESPLEVDYVARPYKLVPGFCELPEVSADGLAYRFRMRQKELTAQDVVDNLERRLVGELNGMRIVDGRRHRRVHRGDPLHRPRERRGEHQYRERNHCA